MKHHVGLTIDSQLFREIEMIRGREKRSTFIEHLIRLGLKTYKKDEGSPNSLCPLPHSPRQTLEEARFPA